MSLPNIFKPGVTQGIIERINKLSPEITPDWGKMNVAQMLSHCNVTYELTYEQKHPRPNAFMRFILRNLVKKIVVGEKPYARNSRTAPVFMATGDKDFYQEKERLVNHIKQTQELGESHFEGKENLSFGAMTATEWNNMFYKHLDHHLTQFGA